MKKYLKIGGVVLLVPVALFALAAIIIPIFFKEDIKKALDKTAQDYINANLNYDENSLSISLIKDFPNVYFGVDNFSIVNQAPFAGDTLISVQEFGISLNIKSVLTNDIQINGVIIDGARIFGKVNSDGKANWDIVKPDSSAADTSSSAMAINIDHWELTNSYIEYDDKTMSLFAALDNINHEGSGDISEIMKFATKTNIDKTYISMDGITYLNNVKLEAINDIEINDDKYTLGENSIKLNDLQLIMKGWASAGDVIDMDLSLETPQNTFKNLISLVPSVFLEGYEDIEANGTFALSGTLKGKMTDTSYPAFNFGLNVKDGTLKYPDLPKPVEAINVDLKVFNETGELNNTTIDIKSLGLKMGSNFVNGRLLVQGIEKFLVDTDIKAKINLAEITQFYPIDGTTLKGLFDVNVVGKGLVDLENNKFPTINGHANLSNGYVKSADFNMPIENLNFLSNYVSDGTVSGSGIDVKEFSLLLDKDKFGGSFSVKDFDAINYIANLHGRVDLGKITKIFPIEGTKLSGIIDINELKTQGSMKMIDTENYAAMNTSGRATIKNLDYVDAEYVPYGLKITSSEVWFTPQKIMIDSYEGFVEKSDMSLTGYLENYMGFMFGTIDTILGGQMTFKSNKFNSNFFFVEEGVTETTPVEESIYIIPNNIHFTLNGKINELIYDDLTLKSFDGQIVLKDGIAYMKNTKFNTLGADFITEGSYNTSDPKNPKYDFNLNISKMPIKEAYSYFNVVKQLAPMADKMDGMFSTNMKMRGNLQQDYMPDMSSLNMDGTLNVIEAVAKVQDIKVLSSISDKTKLQGVNQYTIKDALMTLKVVDGRLSLSPFTMKNGQTNMETTISRGIMNNSILHNVTLDAPSSSLKNGIGALGLDPSAIGDRIKINFDVTGTSLDPKIIMKKAESGGVKSLIKDQATSKVSQAKDDAEARAKAEADKAKAEAEARAKAEADRIRTEAEAKANAEAEKAKAEAKKKLEDELKNKGVKLPSGSGTPKIPGGFK